MNHAKDSDGNSTNRRSKGTHAQEEKAHLAELSYTSVPVSPVQVMGTASMFAKFLHIDGGYLKARREPDSSSVHFTWTWTLGQWARHYVYVRVEYYDAEYGLEVLMSKLLAVEEGRSRPTPDRYIK